MLQTHLTVEQIKRMVRELPAEQRPHYANHSICDRSYAKTMSDLMKHLEHLEGLTGFSIVKRNAKYWLGIEGHWYPTRYRSLNKTSVQTWAEFIRSKRHA